MGWYQCLKLDFTCRGEQWSTMTYSPGKAEIWKLKERGSLGLCEVFQGLLYQLTFRRLTDTWDKEKRTHLIDKKQKNETNCATGKEMEGAKGYFKNGGEGKCLTWLEERRKESKKAARGKEGGREGSWSRSKLKCIFRKMFICRSVKLTRGVYLPALPSLSLSLCYHLLRSLSLSRRSVDL